MKPHFLIDFLNFGFKTTALKQSDSTDFTEVGYDANNLGIDYGTWKSKGTQDFDIYTEIYEAKEINCCVILGSNISPRASVVIAGSNASGVGGFNDPLFQEPLTYSQGKWVFLNTDTALPNAKYFRISVYDPSPTGEAFEIKKIFLGKTETFSIEVIDGFTDTNENYQKREITNGQWNPGTTDSILKIYELEFNAFSGLTTAGKQSREELENFIDRVKTTTPFVLIANEDKPEMFCEYMTIDGDEINFDISEAERISLSLTFKEVK